MQFIRKIRKAGRHHTPAPSASFIPSPRDLLKVFALPECCKLLFKRFRAGIVAHAAVGRWVHSIRPHPLLSSARRRTTVSSSKVSTSDDDEVGGRG